MSKLVELFKQNSEGFTPKLKEVENHIIYYEVYGNTLNPDKTYILSHGAFATGRVMNLIVTKLFEKQPNNKFIIIDQAFHGNSISKTEDIANATVHTYVDVAFKFINLLKDDGEIQGKLHWLGWSMGGSIGLLLDIKGVGFDELTLLNSSPIWYSLDGLIAHVPDVLNEDAIPEIYFSILEDSLQKNISEEDAKAILTQYHEITSRGKVMSQDLRGLVPKHYDVIEQLQEVKAKTLIIGGTEEEVAEIKYQYVLEVNIKDSSLEFIEDNHLLLVKPDMVDLVVQAIMKTFK